MEPNGNVASARCVQGAEPAGKACNRGGAHGHPADPRDGAENEITGCEK